MLRNQGRALGLFMALGATLLAARAQEPLSLSDALTPPSVLQAELSPDGRQVAAIVYTGVNAGLVLIETTDLTSRLISTGSRADFGQGRYHKQPREVRWITKDLMAVDYGLEAEALDLNGKVVSKLGGAVIAKARSHEADSTLMLVFTDEDHDVVAQVDARTGKSRKLRVPMPGTPTRWVFDEQGELRAVTMSSASFWSDTTQLSHWYRSPLTEQWEKLLDFKVTDDRWTPLAVDAARNRLIVASRQGRDTRAVFAYDPVKREQGELLAGHPTEDLYVLDELRSPSYDSVDTDGMKPVRHWFTPRWASLQAAVDQAIPGHVNKLSGNPDGLVLVHSYADVDPGHWLLLDTGKMSLRNLMAVRPRIKPDRMRPMEVVRYPAKDGLAIPAYLTRPAGADGPWPMVVMVHGGPAARDRWQWDAEVQLLATRGYLVFQPQFRGSTGFGKAFEQAGIGQWGLAMQDDITAGVEHLVKQGLADPKRICIYGGSYGGYAALWGLVKTPQLYRCGVTLAGVSDIGELLTDWSDTNSHKLSREFARFQIAAQGVQTLDQVSPVKHAQLIQAPLLIAHGDEDRRVPIGHSKRMMAALDRHHKSYQWVELVDEGHGITRVRNMRKFDEALLKFLDRHIGAGATPAPAAEAAGK